MHVHSMSPRFARLDQSFAEQFVALARLSGIVRKTWKDETAENFFNENLSETETTLSRMIASLHEATELIRSIEKKLADSYEESF